MIDIPTIFDCLGGPAEVARLLKVKPSTAGEMKRRAVIQVKYWPTIVDALNKRGIDSVNYDTLVSLHSRRAA